MDFFLKSRYRSHGESEVQWGLSTPVTQAIHYPSESMIWNDDFQTRNKRKQNKIGMAYAQLARNGLNKKKNSKMKD